MTPLPDLRDQLAAARVVPVVTRVAPSAARAPAAALARGGLSVMEVTLRAAGAIDSIAAIAADPPGGLLVGAGTVLTAAQVEPRWTPGPRSWCRRASRSASCGGAGTVASRACPAS